MIDGREQENIAEWVRKYKKSFGKRPKSGDTKANGTRSMPSSPSKPTAQNGKGKERAVEEDIANDSDASDEDFVAGSDSDGGEPSSDDSSDEDGEGGGAQRGSGDEEDDAEESGSDGEQGGEDEDEEMEEEEEMTAERHPLLRPGAMPRMSKAMDAAVGMVMEDFTGRGKGGDGGEDEDDELEDD